MLQVGWHNAKGELVSEHAIRLTHDSTVQQVLDKVRQVANADPQTELRMLEVFQSKIFKVSVSSCWLPVFVSQMESSTLMGETCHNSIFRVSLWVHSVLCSQPVSCWRGIIQCCLLVLTGRLQWPVCLHGCSACQCAGWP